MNGMHELRHMIHNKLQLSAFTCMFDTNDASEPGDSVFGYPITFPLLMILPSRIIPFSLGSFFLFFFTPFPGVFLS